MLLALWVAGTASPALAGPIEGSYQWQLQQDQQKAATRVRLTDDAAWSMSYLLAALRDVDGVENVYSNAEISHEIMARL